MNKVKDFFKKCNVALLAILIIQCIYMIYWGFQKSGYYVDEFFTYDNAHYMSASTPDRIKLYDADFLTYDEWHNLSDLKSTLTVKKSESLLTDSLKYNVNVLMNKYPYMCLLNYVEAIFFDGSFSKWSAISINIILFLITQIILYKLTLKISNDKAAAAIAVCLYGFSGMAVSMTVYVRFYTLVTMFMTLYTYLHICMLYSSSMVKFIVFEILSLPALFFAYRDSPLSVIQGVGMIGFFVLLLLIKKRYKQAIIYGVPVIGGGFFYAAFKTEYVKYFLNISAAANAENSNVATASLLENLLSLTPSNFVSRTMEFAHIVCRYLFGHSIVLMIYILLAVGAMVLFGTKKNKLNGNGTDCIFLLLLPCVFYGIISICLNLSAIRYNSSIFPEVAACVAVIVAYVFKSSKLKKPAMSIIAVAIAGELVFTCYIPRIENIYLEDRHAIDSMQNYQGIDSIVVDYHYDDKVMYECLAYCDKDTRVMFTAYDTIDYNDWEDTVLVWQSVNQEQKVADEILKSGFSSIDEIGRTHESIIYIASR